MKALIMTYHQTLRYLGLIGIFLVQSCKPLSADRESYVSTLDFGNENVKAEIEELFVLPLEAALICNDGDDVTTPKQIELNESSIDLTFSINFILRNSCFVKITGDVKEESQNKVNFITEEEKLLFVSDKVAPEGGQLKANFYKTWKRTDVQNIEFTVSTDLSTSLASDGINNLTINNIQAKCEGISSAEIESMSFQYNGNSFGSEVVKIYFATEFFETLTEVDCQIFGILTTEQKNLKLTTDSIKFSKISETQWESQNQATLQVSNESVIPEDQYYIKSADNSSTCLDLSGYNTSDNASIISFDCNGGDNQKFSFIPAENGYQIKILSSGKCLSIKDLSSGSSIIQKTCTQINDQIFKLILVNTQEEKKIQSQSSNLCIQFANGNAIQGPCGNSNSPQEKSIFLVEPTVT